MSDCPCRGCADRTLTCHVVCRRYGSWKEEHERMRESRTETGTIREAQPIWRIIRKKCRRKRGQL